MSPAAQHRVIRSGGGGRCFRSTNENFVGCFINFYELFFFFNTIPSEQARKTAISCPGAAAGYPALLHLPEEALQVVSITSPTCPIRVLIGRVLSSLGRRSLPEKKTKRRTLEEISHPWVFSHHCHRRRHHTLFFMPLSHKQS